MIWLKFLYVREKCSKNKLHKRVNVFYCQVAINAHNKIFSNPVSSIIIYYIAND